MFYHPHAYRVGFGDVIAGWLFCLAVAATGFACAAVSATPDRAVAALAAPPTAPGTAICDEHNSPARISRG